jgi:hypothetical protein
MMKRVLAALLLMRPGLARVLLSLANWRPNDPQTIREAR